MGHKRICHGKYLGEKIIMEIKRIYYNDDNILVPGHLIRRKFRKPVFYPFNGKCGFDYEVVGNKRLIIEYTKEAYRKFYKTTYPEGTRIVLVSRMNGLSSIPAYTKGTVDSVDDSPTIHCRFDNGKHLGIVPGVDMFRKVSENIK